MADKKISQLTAATTPLDGTEVLPIVQSGTTVKVANNDLRPKQIQSNATSGVLQVTGPAAASTRVMTTPDANFTAARTDAAQTFTGNQTFSNNVNPTTLSVGVSAPTSGWISELAGRVKISGTNNYMLDIVNGGTNGTQFQAYLDNGEIALVQGGTAATPVNFYVAGSKRLELLTTGNVKISTGNVIQGTAAKGVDFSANTPAAGKTSTLLNWYEEGTFTATRTGFTEVLGGGTITSTGTYTRVGRMVFVNISLVCAGGATIAGASGIGSYFSGIPFTPAVATSGTWVDISSVAATGGVLINTDAKMYLATGWTASNHSWVFSATFAV